VVRVGLARARVCGGEKGAERELAQAMEQLAQQDGLLTLIWTEVTRTLAAAGHTEEAFASLRRIVAGPSDNVPEELRHDPYFVRLKADPRFEEILKSAKPL
jgi:hypothetical protein